MSTQPSHELHSDIQDEAQYFPYRMRFREDGDSHFQHRTEMDAATRRSADPDFAEWAKGYGAVVHSDETQVRIHRLISDLMASGRKGAASQFISLMHAADRLASAAMWLTVHMTYARRVRFDGAPLTQEDFKPIPDGHTGGSLNMVPAYVGYLLANALSGRTRSWLMGQGHCVAAIDSVNVLTQNLHPEQSARYTFTEEGLSRLCADFYSYAISPDGYPATPLGSHVNAHTAGGLIEGGYLGFAELQYVHMPLPGESLVAFLSDGSFEEQRGADWAPRWWRASDCGMVLPVMLLNGRRIEQRSSMEQEGGVRWFAEHLRLNHFDPIVIDGRDPAAFAWAILEAETRLQACASAAQAGHLIYPAPLHYVIAVSEKGYGFPGAGTNKAHNLPLDDNPSASPVARDTFNQASAQLWVSSEELTTSVRVLATHSADARVLERDHSLTVRRVSICPPDDLPWINFQEGSSAVAMKGIDDTFLSYVRANPSLRVRVGNPDELRSNGMSATLVALKHRSTLPEEGSPEAIDGAVITALNEEAVVSAALGNKGGINLVVTYEAFGTKMLGAMRQESNFSRHRSRAGRPPGWLSVPFILSSHAWENGKNELSHQDTSLCEAWMAEPIDVARTVFPPDANSAIACLEACYGTTGQLWVLVVPKRSVKVWLSSYQARLLVSDGALRIVGHGGEDEKLVLVAIGAYQLIEVMKASSRLAENGVLHSVVVINEAGKLRAPRDSQEAGRTMPKDLLAQYFPAHSLARVICSHARPELLTGVLRQIDTGIEKTIHHGFINRGGTLDTFGMMYANRCTWAHLLESAASALQTDITRWLDEREIAAVQGRAEPRALDFALTKR